MWCRPDPLRRVRPHLFELLPPGAKMAANELFVQWCEMNNATLPVIEACGKGRRFTAVDIEISAAMAT